MCSHLVLKDPGAVLGSKEDYEVIGLTTEASPREVKLAYYHLAIANRPGTSSSPDAEQRFAAIGAAYSSITGVPFVCPSSTAPTSSPSEPPMTAIKRNEQAFPRWMYRLTEYLERVPQRFDLWLMPSWSSVIYQHLRKGELAQALYTLDEMKSVGDECPL